MDRSTSDHRRLRALYLGSLALTIACERNPASMDDSPTPSASGSTDTTPGSTANAPTASIGSNGGEQNGAQGGGTMADPSSTQPSTGGPDVPSAGSDDDPGAGGAANAGAEEDGALLPFDAGAPDPTLDAGPVIDGPEGPLEAGAPAPGDASAACVAYVMPADCTIPDGAVLPADLRCTGLYADWQSRTLYCRVESYAPAYPLWSDGLDKPRYVWLPPGSQVDVSDPDAFVYPVGTQFWKEFRFPDGKLAETRLMRRLERGWIYTTYVWNDAETEAVQDNDGEFDLHGRGHTVPSRDQCKECHSGRPDFILGWDALMLGAGSTGLSRERLLELDLVTWQGRESGTENPLGLAIPGDEIERAALGYLHANCGVSCHNDSADALALETGFFMRLEQGTLGSVQETLSFSTGLERAPSPNAPISGLPPAPGGGSYVDLRPLDPERSLTLVRMLLRDDEAAMPRLGTNVVDEAGASIVRAWIESMTEERGYPAPSD